MSFHRSRELSFVPVQHLMVLFRADQPEKIMYSLHTKDRGLVGAEKLCLATAAHAENSNFAQKVKMSAWCFLS